MLRLLIAEETGPRATMPIFFFDIDDGSVLTVDREGTDLPDLKAARDAAISILPDIARDELPAGKDHDFASSVRDASGKVVFKASMKLRSDYVN